MLHLDKQIQYYTKELIELVGFDIEQCNNLASKIYDEVFELTPEARNIIKNSSPVPLKDRHDELIAFQAMTDIVSTIPNSPALTRTQIITQNYICFVYLKDNFFSDLERIIKFDSLTQRCCKYLLSARIKNFRNAIAHGHWKYNSDFSGFEYWNSRNINGQKIFEKYEVVNEEYDFWQKFSKVVAYSSITAIMKS